MNHKAALITGGARRLGRVTALALADEGYDIALHYWHSAEEAGQLYDEIKAKHVECHLFQQDLTKLEELGGVIRDVHEHFPELSVLVNNASTFKRISLEEMTPESLEQDLAINFKAPLFLMQSFALEVKQGAIVNMLDMAIDGYCGAYFAYLLAKKSLAEATKMAARELGPNIRINGVCPGFVLPTEGKDAGMHDPSRVFQLPMGQPTPADVARAVVTCVRSPFMTGQMMYVDGGERLL